MTFCVLVLVSLAVVMWTSGDVVSWSLNKEAGVCGQCCFATGPDLTPSSLIMDVQSCLQPCANERIAPVMMTGVTAAPLV